MSYNNPAFVGDDQKTEATRTVIELTSSETNNNGQTQQHQPHNQEPNGVTTVDVTSTTGGTNNSAAVERDNWGNGLEFLMSCIAMSVGLGNVWRFPFTALENGGGAFLIPYIIVLLVIGRPLYYMEMVIGQFSSRGCVKMYDMVPALRGVGYGQVISTGIVATYYVSIMAITLHYLYNSFKSVLPWTVCEPEWGDICVAASHNVLANNTLIGSTKGLTSSAELYYTKNVLKEYSSIDKGIGAPDIYLTICLALAWLFILAVLIRGVQSSGKAAYFLAIFPYVVLSILLVRAVTLPGAIDGILYFIRPQWDKLLDAKVWYAAITQCFFSLAVCFGNIIMYSSFNKFNHNVYRDAKIVTTLDTFTSLLAGCTIFGILGHLAQEVGTNNIGDVVKGGAGLAFISYPEAIARFKLLPQVFAIMFFFMLFVLGIGSNIAMCSCVITAVRDNFPNLKMSYAVIGVTLVGFLIGLTYITPGGQYILTLVDFFGATFIVFVLGIVEIVAVCWIYGVNRLCRDIEFMLNRNTGIYWRICWGILTPSSMILILFYMLSTFKPVTYNGYVFPNFYYAFGWCITALGLIPLPLWAFRAIIKQKGVTWTEKIVAAFQPHSKWGPVDPTTYEKYQKFISNWKNDNELNRLNTIYAKFKRLVFE